ncbi:MAG: sigma 54-interacting transcriptional regulator, partial [Myxococcota bacterium]
MEIKLKSDKLEDALGHPVVHALLEHISDGALVIAAGDHRVVAMNPVARELLAYREDEVVGCQCRRIMNSPTCTTACPLERMMQGFETSASKDGHRMYYRGSGSAPILHASTRMILVRNPAGEPLGAIELFRDLRRVRHLEAELRRRRSLHGIVGHSEALQRLYELVEQIAPYDLPVLITGASGVGKERFADALHHLSSRSEHRLIKVNCAALAPTLVESELFGHVKGAFTGAHTARTGRFVEADGSTILLDEVGELAPELQAKLLRVLQEGEVQPLGSEATRHVDVRVLAATNRDLAVEVREGRFRQDLYYRLLGAEVHIPPLSERPEDIEPLAEYVLGRFLQKQALRVPGEPPLSFNAAALERLVTRSWP